MSNQISDQFPTDKVRAILNNHSMRDDEKIAEIKAMLPAPVPALPTLADMDEEERAASQWMRANVAGDSTRYVIADPRDEDNDTAILFSEEGKPEWVLPEYVVPRPDLPRMPWTDNEKVAPALPGKWRLADHKRIGRVIVTNPAPNPGGHIYFVTSDDEDARGYQWGFCTPDDLTYIDEGADQ